VGQLDVADLRRSWDEVLGLVGRRSKRVAALARDAVVRALDGETVTLVVKSPALASMLSDGSGAVVDALHEVFGGTWHVRCEVGGSDQAAFEPARTAARPEPARTPPARPEARSEPTPMNSAADDWPTPARPGGETAPAQADGGAGEPGGATEVPAAPTPRGAGPAGGRTKAKTASGSGRSRAAAAPVAKAAPAAYDPFEGFDDGDEPLDDEPGSAGPRESSEEQALKLLAEHLGAEKIGEVEHR
jgi:DNA polymerase-3 subunit gamma/tau